MDKLWPTPLMVSNIFDKRIAILKPNYTHIQLVKMFEHKTRQLNKNRSPDSYFISKFTVITMCIINVIQVCDVDGTVSTMYKGNTTMNCKSPFE